MVKGEVGRKENLKGGNRWGTRDEGGRKRKFVEKGGGLEEEIGRRGGEMWGRGT